MQIQLVFTMHPAGFQAIDSRDPAANKYHQRLAQTLTIIPRGLGRLLETDLYPTIVLHGDTSNTDKKWTLDLRRLMYVPIAFVGLSYDYVSRLSRGVFDSSQPHIFHGISISPASYHKVRILGVLLTDREKLYGLSCWKHIRGK